MNDLMFWGESYNNFALLGRQICIFIATCLNMKKIQKMIDRTQLYLIFDSILSCHHYAYHIDNVYGLTVILSSCL